MYKAVKQKFLGLPTPLQYLIGGATLFLAYKVVFKNPQDTNNENLIKDTDKELKENLKQNKLTFAPSQYGAFANIIYESTKYGIGDNYGAVTDTLKKMQNNADVNFLTKIYGARQNYVFGIPVGEKRDLFTNVRAELGNELGFLKVRIDNINKDWATKKIKYRF